MILVDTSVWIDHFRSTDADLARLLHHSSVWGHSWITGEIALGNLRRRTDVLGLLQGLPQATVATSDEVMRLIEQKMLYGAGIGFVDAQLLAATKLTHGAKLWTRDKCLAKAARRLALGFQPTASTSSARAADTPT